MVERSWGSLELAVEWSKDIWPHETDPAWFRDYATWTRSCVSPGDAAKLLRVDAETDVCDLLPTIGVPTLILHRVGDRVGADRGGALPGGAHPRCDPGRAPR